MLLSVWNLWPGMTGSVMLAMRWLSLWCDAQCLDACMLSHDVLTICMYVLTEESMCEVLMIPAGKGSQQRY